jgi:hypothetical protein
MKDDFNFLYEWVLSALYIVKRFLNFCGLVIDQIEAVIHYIVDNHMFPASSVSSRRHLG